METFTPLRMHAIDSRIIEVHRVATDTSKGLDRDLTNLTSAMLLVHDEQVIEEAVSDSIAVKTPTLLIILAVIDDASTVARHPDLLRPILLDVRSEIAQPSIEPSQSEHETNKRCFT